MISIVYKDLGLLSYSDAWHIQKNHFTQLLESKRIPSISKNKAKNYFLVCEHDPVYTLGKNGSTSNIIEESGLQIKNVVRTDRGGDVTFHGPGQIVGYPILDLEYLGIGLKTYIYQIEQVIIDTIAKYNLVGSRLEGANGVWLDADHPIKARKICAIGVKCSRYITMHGFSFNINTDLSYFGKIIPCGIQNKSVTSLQNELKSFVNLAEVQLKLKIQFEKVFRICLLEE